MPIGIFSTTSWLGLLEREATAVVFTRVGYLQELVFKLLIQTYKKYSDSMKGDIFLYQTMETEKKYVEKLRRNDKIYSKLPIN